MLQINEKFKSLIPPLTEEEYKELEQSILSEGCREPLTVWDGVIVDGHHRYEICTKHNIPFNTRDIHFENEDEAMIWIITNQLSRRNITDFVRVELALKRKDLLLKQGKEKMRLAGRAGAEARWGLSQNDKPYTQHNTQAIIAKDLGLSTGTVAQAEVILKKAPEETKEKLRRGELTISAAYRKLKKEEEIRKARESIAAQVASSPVKPVISLQDWKSWLEEQPQCDLLITDPPYMTDVDNIDVFAKWLPVALSKVKNTGFAYVFIGAYPEELRAYLNVSNPTQILIWTYRNVLGVMPKDRYRLNYQAILFFRMPEAPDLNCPITNEQWAVHDISQQGMLGGDRMYKWQKPDELAERLIRHSTKPGDLVLDCFAGSGTFLIAASKLGRVARGCEIDEEVVKIAEQRGCMRA